jgi:thiol-disulfide isomerase/thioredoxin
VLLLAGCNNVGGTGDKRYIAGQGQITEVKASDRGGPVSLTAKTLDGKTLSLADLRGEPVVVNVWWSGCPPCRVEQPMLNDIADELGSSAHLVGINIKDSSPDNALAYARSHDVAYPSIYDPSGKALLAFQGKLSPRTIPSTLVLDSQGRIAAAISGRIPTKLTLLDLVDGVSS